MRNFGLTDFVLLSSAHSCSIVHEWADERSTKSVNPKLRTSYWRYGLAVKTTFLTQYLSNLNPEGEVSSSKIDGFMGNYISKLKWAWQAQFLSYVLLILRNNLFFEDKQMILLSLFDISAGLRFQKNLKSFPIQFLSHLWLSLVPIELLKEMLTLMDWSPFSLVL